MSKTIANTYPGTCMHIDRQFAGSMRHVCPIKTHNINRETWTSVGHTEACAIDRACVKNHSNSLAFLDRVLKRPWSTVLKRHFPGVLKRPPYLFISPQKGRNNKTLVGGWTNPFEKYSWKWIISPSFGVTNPKLSFEHHHLYRKAFKTTTSSKSFEEPKNKHTHTVDGRNPAPPGMCKTL